jgi:hypothetical protein
MLSSVDPMSGTPQNPAIYELTLEAIAAASEQRHQQRFPLFRPLTIVSKRYPDQEPVRGFARVLSPFGLGMLHRMPVKLGPVTLKLPDVEGTDVEVGFDILWCTSNPGEWYLSGGITKESPDDARAIRVLMSAVDRKSTHRLATRLSYFRPALITFEGGRSVTTGFTRDISSQAIGLLHDVPVNIGPIRVRVSALNGEELDLRVDIEWCKQNGEGWYISGGRFVQLVAEQLPNLYL